MYVVTITNGFREEKRKISAKRAENRMDLAEKMVGGLLNSAWSVVEGKTIKE